MKKPLKQILRENMRRFGTKNLNEDPDQNNNGYPDETEEEKTPSGNLNRVDKKKSLKVGDVTTFSSGKYKGKKVKIIKVLDNGKYELELVTEDKNL